MIELFAWIVQATFFILPSGSTECTPVCLDGHTQVLGSTEGFLGRPRPHRYEFGRFKGESLRGFHELDSARREWIVRSTVERRRSMLPSPWSQTAQEGHHVEKQSFV